MCPHRRFLGNIRPLYEVSQPVRCVIVDQTLSAPSVPVIYITVNESQVRDILHEHLHTVAALSGECLPCIIRHIALMQEESVRFVSLAVRCEPVRAHLHALCAELVCLGKYFCEVAVYSDKSIVLICRVRHELAEVDQSAQMVVIDAEIAPVSQVVVLVQDDLAQPVCVQVYTLRLIEGRDKRIVSFPCLRHDQTLYDCIRDLVHADRRLHDIAEADTRILPVYCARAVQILSQSYIDKRHIVCVRRVFICLCLHIPCVSVLIVGDEFLCIVFSSPYPGAAPDACAE